MPLFPGYLDASDLLALTQAAIQTGVVNRDRDLLLANIRPGFVGSLREAKTRIDQFRLDLNGMNRIERLEDGSVPLVEYLTNIATMLRLEGREEAAVFERYANQVGNRSQGVPELPPPTAIPEIIQQELIVHQDDTLAIGFLASAMRVGRSVARIDVPRFSGKVQQMLGPGKTWLMNGTGWLIADDLLITNHHVINAREQNETAATEEEFGLQALGSSVAFDFDDDDSSPDMVSVTGLLLSNSSLDYAILQLARAPGRPVLRLRLNALTVQPSTYLPVNIIQHPRGKPKRIAIRNNLVSGGDETTLRYFTDTDLGSSGAPVCDDTWRAVALHRGAQWVNNVNFQGKQTAYVNFGSRITAVVADVGARNTALHARIVAAQS